MSTPPISKRVRHSGTNGGASEQSSRFGADVRHALARLARWRLRRLQALALAIGCIATIAGGLWMQSEIESDARTDFAMRVSVVADELESRVRAYSDVAFAVRALMEYRGASQVTREDFRRFADSLALDQRYPGLLNVSFSRHVVNAERPAFERRMRAEYEGLLPKGASFEIKPAGERGDYDIVAYVEPLAGNVPALGIDLAAEPIRNEAVRRARDSGALSATRGMKLLRPGEDNAMSVLLRLAVYDSATLPLTTEARRSSYVGVAGVAIRLPDMIEATIPEAARTQSRFVIADVTDSESATGINSPGTLLYDSRARTGGDVPPIAFAEYGVSRHIAVGERTWEVRVTPVSDPLRGAVTLLPFAAAAAILTISVLLAGLLQSLDMAYARGRALRRHLRTIESQRQRLAETQEIADIGAWEWDIRQNVQIWSDRLYELLGRAVGDPPAPTDEFFASHVVHPDDVAMVREALKRVLKDGKPVEVECRVRRPDGSERIVSSVTRLEAADDGAHTRLVGTVRDITEQQRAAARERERLVFIQTMMDAIPMPVFQKDPSGRYQACNDAFCRYAGRPRDQIIGRTFDGYAPGPHVEAVRAQDRALLERPSSSAIHITLPSEKAGPRELVVHKASYLAADGTIAGVVGAVYDITELKRAEARLKDTIEELDHRNAVSLLLGEFSEVLQSCMSLDEAYEIVSKYLGRLAPSTAGALYRIDPGYGRGEKVVGWGDAPSSTPSLTADACVAVRRNRARSVADSTIELNCRHFDGEPPPAYACLPLTAHGELVGMLHVERPNAEAPDDFASDTGWMALTTAAEHIALAIANLALRETLREQATRDKLTGLYNRHYLNARFEQEIARAKRSGQPLAVVMLDIDHFKRFNDTFGHAAGDHVLRELGRVVSGSARKSDVACRYGGEEFVLFLPDTGAEVALGRAEEIRAALKALQLDWEGQPLGTVTLSAGVATYPAHGEDPDTLLRFADRALYRAKQLGRDRVVLEASPVGIAKSA